MNPVSRHVTGPMRRRPGLLRAAGKFTIIALLPSFRLRLKLNRGWAWPSGKAQPAPQPPNRSAGRAALITLTLGDQCREAFSREAMATCFDDLRIDSVRSRFRRRCELHT